MKKLIFVVLFMALCIPGLAQERYIITPETHQILEPFANELIEYEQNMVTDDMALKAEFGHFHAVLLDIFSMVFIEETHSESNKESIGYIRARIECESANMDRFIAYLSKDKKFNKMLLWSKRIKELLLKIDKELPTL